MAQLFVKDQECAHENEYYKVLLYSHDGKCDDFFGVSSEEAAKSKEVGKKLDILKKFNVWVDGIVEKNEEGYLFLRDTVMRY